MSILFKGNLEEGNYTLIKTTDGWVLKGKTPYVGFNFADRPQGEWENYKDEHRCSHCGEVVIDDWHDTDDWYDFCPNCGARMKGADDEISCR